MVQQPGPVHDIRYTWVNHDEISVAATHAVIAAEDQKFLTHHGLDFDSIDQAIDDYRSGEGLRGASTITQQVAKNLFLWPGRSFVRKVLEAYFALLIEVCWSKQRILEMYLNIAELGPGVFGVEAAAQEFFKTRASALTAAQAALLAAVLPNPQRFLAAQPNVYVRGRQAAILAQMKLLEVRGHYRGLPW
jgi:monofunctional biosynthetic peptidoglycan transglycosylase